MQLQTYDANLTDAAQGSQKFAPQPSMRLEDEAEEETEIRDLEEQINQARRSIEDLSKELQRTYKSWIERLNAELEEATDETVRQKIRNQLERARLEYGP
jgi:predicted RNase H-like nuclease (RuvC/YqgF family)